MGEEDAPVSAADEPVRGSVGRAFLRITSLNMHCSHAVIVATVALLHRHASSVHACRIDWSAAHVAGGWGAALAHPDGVRGGHARHLALRLCV